VSLETLAREVATILAALSTPAKQKSEKKKKTIYLLQRQKKH